MNQSRICLRARHLSWLLFGLAAGCLGYAVQPTGITDTSATLQAAFECDGNTTNTCTAWWQYWVDGSSTIHETQHLGDNYATGGTSSNLSWNLTGLASQTLYHYEFCGFGDTTINPPGICTGPLTGSALSSANLPQTAPDPGDFNATANFRTAGPSSKGTFDLGRPLTTIDTNSSPITRDGGYSIQYSSDSSLWIFGDTQQNHAGFDPYGTAAAGTFTQGQAPASLNELPTPPAAPVPGLPGPSPFFNVPDPLLQQNGDPCGTNGASYAADWVLGGAKEPAPSSNLLIVYGEMCVEPHPPSVLTYTMERLALAEYDPVGNAFLRVDHPFVASPLNAGLPPQEMLASPVFGGGGSVYLFGADQQGNVYVARAANRASQWAHGSNYHWWNGSYWDGNVNDAASIIPAVIYPPGFVQGQVSVGDYRGTGSQTYALIMEVSVKGTFDVYTATSLQGPWTLDAVTTVPDPCDKGLFGCYAVIGHPELSSSTQLVYSWYSPSDRDAYGHVRLGAVNW